jgi:biotin synthase
MLMTLPAWTRGRRRARQRARAAPGTPLADRPPVDPIELVRMIATARILMQARVRTCRRGNSPLARAQVL